MNSAIVESGGRMPARALPHYCTPEQVRQILAAIPAGRPLAVRPAAVAGHSSPTVTLNTYLVLTPDGNCSRLRGQVGLQSKFRAWAAPL